MAQPWWVDHTLSLQGPPLRTSMVVVNSSPSRTVVAACAQRYGGGVSVGCLVAILTPFPRGLARYALEQAPRHPMLLLPVDCMPVASLAILSTSRQPVSRGLSTKC
jgi:hypothetical protein